MLRDLPGQRLLTESERAGWSQYAWLQPHFQGQKRGSFCALASCALILNALRSQQQQQRVHEEKDKDEAKETVIAEENKGGEGNGEEECKHAKKKRRSGGGHRGEDVDTIDASTESCAKQKRPALVMVTQDDLFRDIVMKHFHEQEKDMHKGLHLSQVARMFELAGAHVVLRCSEDPVEVSRWLKDDIAAVLRSRDRCLVVNLWRDFEGHRGGHVSPLAAYHPQRQMVLLLDVASHRTTPHWLSVHDLVPLLCRVDSWSGLARGYFVVSLPGLNSSLQPA